LPCIYTRSGDLASEAVTLVSYHAKNPSYYDEFKICLPPSLTHAHHLLFTLYHSPVQIAKNKDVASEVTSSLPPCIFASMLVERFSSPSFAALPYCLSLSPQRKVIGYAWLPLFANGRMAGEDHQVPLAANIAPSYLSSEGSSHVRGLPAVFKLGSPVTERTLIRGVFTITHRLYTRRFVGWTEVRRLCV
jgi:hypothetical protein